jgi:hypothetical protein
MEAIVVISILYWIAAGLMLLIGIIKIIIAAANSQPAKAGLKLVITSVIMLVVGVGACALILGGINIQH